MADTTTSLTGLASPTARRSRFVGLLPDAACPQDRDFLRDLMVLGGILFALTMIAYLGTVQWTWPFPRDRVTLVLGRDFLNLWMFGRAAFDGDPARFYDAAIYNAELATLLGSDYVGQNLPNPPTAMVAMAPFGLLNYFPALFAWVTVSIAAFVMAGKRELADARVLVLVAISPAALLCVISGQSSFLTAAALIAIFATLDRRPILAGALIGLLTIKPQLGVLFPVALIASRRWSTIAAAAATTLALLTLSIALDGFDIWRVYIFKAMPLQREVLADASGIAMPFHTTVFMNLRGWLGNSFSAGVQGAVTVGAAVLVAWAFYVRRNADAATLRALFLACSVSASPYMGSYDMLPLTFAAIALLAGGKLDQTGRRLAQLVFWTPALQLLFGAIQAPGPGLIPPLFAIYLARRLQTQAHDAPITASTPAAAIPS